MMAKSVMWLHSHVVWVAFEPVSLQPFEDHSPPFLKTFKKWQNGVHHSCQTFLLLENWAQNWEKNRSNLRLRKNFYNCWKTLFLKINIVLLNLIKKTYNEKLVIQVVHVKLIPKVNWPQLQDYNYLLMRNKAYVGTFLCISNHWICTCIWIICRGKRRTGALVVLCALQGNYPHQPCSSRSTATESELEQTTLTCTIVC